MKITIVNRHRQDALGGSEVQCDFIANELMKRGYDVSYVVPGGEKKNYETAYTTKACKKETDDLISKIDSSNPDIVYWRYHKNHLYDTLKFLHAKGVKIIFAVSSEYDVHRFLYKKNETVRGNVRRFLRDFFAFRGFRFVDAVVVNNKDHLDKLPVRKQKYIPNGMSTERIPFRWEKPYCAWIANIKAIKRPELYIKLAKEFEARGIDFIMVGDVQEDGYSWIRTTNDVPSNLHYLGPKSLEEVNGILNGSLIHVHTCLAEGFPNVFIQAWHQGKPSVSYGFDPADYIKNNKLGYCSEEDWNLFVKNVSELITDKQLRDEMGDNAQKFAQKMFQVEKSVNMLEEVFESV